MNIHILSHTHMHTHTCRQLTWKQRTLLDKMLTLTLWVWLEILEIPVTNITDNTLSRIIMLAKQATQQNDAASYGLIPPKHNLKWWFCNHKVCTVITYFSKTHAPFPCPCAYKLSLDILSELQLLACTRVELSSQSQSYFVVCFTSPSNISWKDSPSSKPYFPRKVHVIRSHSK